jgi:hypothetical protein
MPPLAPHTGALLVDINGDDVSVRAAFGVAEQQCETVASEGACISELCMPRQEFAMVPDAGVIAVSTPDGRVRRFRPSGTAYEDVTVYPPFVAGAASFTFTAEGSEVPPFTVDIVPPGPLFAVAAPGADPRNANADLEIARTPDDADFELVMTVQTGPRVRCSFTGGPAIVPKRVLSTLPRVVEVSAFAVRATKRRVMAGDYAIDAKVFRDSRTFTLRLQPGSSSGP